MNDDGSFLWTCPECGTQGVRRLGDFSAWTCDACGYVVSASDHEAIIDSLKDADGCSAEWAAAKPFKHEDVNPLYASAIRSSFPQYAGFNFWDDFSVIDCLHILAAGADFAESMPLVAFPEKAWAYVDIASDSIRTGFFRASSTGDTHSLERCLNGEDREKTVKALKEVDALLSHGESNLLASKNLCNIVELIAKKILSAGFYDIVRDFSTFTRKALLLSGLHIPGEDRDVSQLSPCDLIAYNKANSGKLNLDHFIPVLHKFSAAEWTSLLSERTPVSQGACDVISHCDSSASIGQSDWLRMLSANDWLVGVCPKKYLTTETLVLRYVKEIKAGKVAALPWKDLSENAWVLLLSNCGNQIPKEAIGVLNRWMSKPLSNASLVRVLVANRSILKYVPKRRISGLTSEQFAVLCKSLDADVSLLKSYDVQKLSDKWLAELLTLFPSQFSTVLDWKCLPVKRIYAIAQFEPHFASEYPDKEKYRIFASISNPKKPSARPIPSGLPRRSPAARKPPVKPAPKTPSGSMSSSGNIVLKYSLPYRSGYVSPAVEKAKTLIDSAIAANATAVGLLVVSTLSLIIGLFWTPWWLIGICCVIGSLIFKSYVTTAKKVTLIYNVDPQWMSAAARRQAVISSLGKASKVWRMTAIRAVDKKYNGGIDWLADRAECMMAAELPFPMESKTRGFRITIDGCKYVALPDCVYVFTSDGVKTVTYQDVSCTCEIVNYAEMQGCPEDGLVAYQTYKIINKDGSRDKRYNYNPVIDVCRYTHVRLRIGRSTFDLLLSNASAMRGVN